MNFQVHPLAEQILIIGKDGFIGQYLSQHYWHAQLIATSRRENNPYFFDLAQPQLANLPLKETKFLLIPAGVTGYLFCQNHPDLSYQVNVVGLLNLVEQAIALDLVPVIFSTDSVFDGEVGGYLPESPTNPLNVYGQHKAEAEQLIQTQFPGRTIILRLGKIFGVTKGDGTLIDEMLAKLSRGESIQAGTDLIFAPLCILDFLAALDEILRRDFRGIIHICGAQALSRYQLGCQVAEVLGASLDLVQAMTVAELAEDFKRPLNTSMIPSHLLTWGFQWHSLNHWIKQLVDAYLALK